MLLIRWMSLCDIYLDPLSSSEFSLAISTCARPTVVIQQLASIVHFCDTSRLTDICISPKLFLPAFFGELILCVLFHPVIISRFNLKSPRQHILQTIRFLQLSPLYSSCLAQKIESCNLSGASVKGLRQGTKFAFQNSLVL